MAKYIMHCDANSAYLSWTAVYMMQRGHTLDIRTVPSIIGGNEKSRHGIVLAKSIPAKRYGIQTGETLRDAYKKCPTLLSYSPDYNLYMKASSAMVEILNRYSDRIQRFSIDECFFEYSDTLTGISPEAMAQQIKDEIKQELGFTVNIGISTNKLLAKMASDFKKPDQAHTLYHEEIEEKMWLLPISDLFMVGVRTNAQLKRFAINTIGDLAKSDPNFLRYYLKSHGTLIWNYANGIDYSTLRKSNHEVIKGIGNSSTAPFDILTRDEASMLLLLLCETVGTRLRSAKLCTGLISVSIKSTEFTGGSHQRKIHVTTDSTNYIHKIAMELFDELWQEQPLRKIGIRVSDLYSNDYIQLSLLEQFDFETQRRIDYVIDKIRMKYGSDAIIRSSFLYSGFKPITGGMQDDGENEYPIMTSIL